MCEYILTSCFQIKSLFEDPSGERKESSDSSGVYISVHKEVPQPARGFTVEQTNHIQGLNQEVISLRRELNQLKVSVVL